VDISRKWLPAPRVPNSSFPLSIALSLTARSSASSRYPPLSTDSRSIFSANPLAKVQRSPLSIALRASLADTFNTPFEPTPEGTRAKSFLPIDSSFGRTIFSSREVRITLTPQFMSNPTPPGDTMPSSMSNAATPPIGKAKP